MTSYMREWEIELTRWCYIEWIKAMVCDHVDRFDTDITRETHKPCTVHVPP